MTSQTVRVLHIYRTYFPHTQGGLEESIRQLCMATQAYGTSNTIFTLATPPFISNERRPEGEVVRARSWVEVASCNIGLREALTRCREAADEADIIQVHFPWPFADLMLPWIRRSRQPLVVTYVSDIVRQRCMNLLYAPLRNRLLQSASCIVASSPHYARTSKVLQAQKEKVCIIPHGLAALPAPDPDRVRHWKAKLGDNFFLFIGVLRYYKGLEFLVEASPKVTTPIILVGDGPCRSELERHISRTPGSSVIMLGSLSDTDKFALLYLCKGVVFPSHVRSEAFGMTLLEGAAYGKPLVTCDIGTGTSWINLHDQTGLVVQPSDPNALSQALNTLARDDVLCQRLGAAAKERWQEHFSAEVIGKAYSDLYANLLATRR